mgnify:CR=1 FL=1
MIKKFVQILSRDELLFKREDLLDEEKRLTKNGAENFLGVLSTLLLNYTSEKEPKWLIDTFDLFLKNQLSIASSFRIFMMSLYDHKFSDGAKTELLNQLRSSIFNDRLLLNEDLHDFLQEYLVDEISLHRNMELASFLIKDASHLLSISSKIKTKSSAEILRRVSQEDFEKNLPNIIQNRIPSEKKASVAAKVFLYNCIKYQYPCKYI